MLSDRRRILLLVRREVQRRSAAYGLATITVVLVGVGYLVRGPYADFGLVAGHVVAPLVLLPFAAHLVVRDRESGFSEIAPGLGVPLGVGLGAKALVVFAASAAIQAIALAGDLIALPDVNAAALGRATRFAAAGLLFGVTSGLFGLTIGLVARASAAAIVIATFAALAAGGLAYLPASELVLDGPVAIEGFAHASPVTWGIHATTTYDGRTASDAAAWGALGSFLVGGAGLLLAVASTQGSTGWSRGDEVRIQPRTWAFSLLFLLALASVGGLVRGVGPVEGGENEFRRPFLVDGRSFFSQGQFDVPAGRGELLVRIDSPTAIDLDLAQAFVMSPHIRIESAEFPSGDVAVAPTARGYVHHFAVRFSGEIHTFRGSTDVIVGGIGPFEDLLLGAHLDIFGVQGVPDNVWPVFAVLMAGFWGWSRWERSSKW